MILSPDTEQYAGRGQQAMDIRGIAAVARRMEDLGFDGLTVPEAGHDPFLPLAIVAEHTRRVSLGTNVAIAFPRSPMVTAQVAWDLQRLSDGRFHLGLGTQVRAHNERRYASPWTEPPGPRMREYLLCMRAIFDAFQNGTRPEFGGEHYRFSLLPPFFNPGPIEHPHVRVHLAALNRYMARLAGELCDGLRLHPIATFRFAREVVQPAVRQGAERAGRRLSDVDVIGAPFLALGRNDAELEKARRALKQHIAFYASTPTYHTVLACHGWNDLGEQLHRLSRENRWTEMPELISDEMLEEWAIVATCDELAAKLSSRCTGLFTSVLLDLPAWLQDDEAWIRETIDSLKKA